MAHAEGAHKGSSSESMSRAFLMARFWPLRLSTDTPMGTLSLWLIVVPQTEHWRLTSSDPAPMRFGCFESAATSGTGHSQHVYQLRAGHFTGTMRLLS